MPQHLKLQNEILLFWTTGFTIALITHHLGLILLSLPEAAGSGLLASVSSVGSWVLAVSCWLFAIGFALYLSALAAKQYQDHFNQQIHGGLVDRARELADDDEDFANIAFVVFLTILAGAMAYMGLAVREPFIWLFSGFCNFLFAGWFPGLAEALNAFASFIIGPLFLLPTLILLLVILIFAPLINEDADDDEAAAEPYAP